MEAADAKQIVKSSRPDIVTGLRRGTHCATIVFGRGWEQPDAIVSTAQLQYLCLVSLLTPSKAFRWLFVMGLLADNTTSIAPQRGIPLSFGDPMANFGLRQEHIVRYVGQSIESRLSLGLTAQPSQRSTKINDRSNNNYILAVAIIFVVVGKPTPAPRRLSGIIRSTEPKSSQSAP